MGFSRYLITITTPWDWTSRSVDRSTVWPCLRRSVDVSRPAVPCFVLNGTTFRRPPLTIAGGNEETAQGQRPGVVRGTADVFGRGSQQAGGTTAGTGPRGDPQRPRRRGPNSASVLKSEERSRPLSIALPNAVDVPCVRENSALLPGPWPGC